jgi:D-amino-acid dehydrogenase
VTRDGDYNGTDMSSHTIVLGGGIVGLSAACFLARRGHRVTVIERDLEAVGASAGNAGIIAPGHPPLPSPAVRRRALRLLLDRASPLYVGPRLDRELLRWLVGFLAACGLRRFERSLAILCRLGLAARECFVSLVECEGIECGFSSTGWLEVFRDRRGFDHGCEVAAQVRRHGYRVEEFDGEELCRREPAFRPGLSGALLYADSAFAHPGRLMAGLRQAAVRHGAVLRCGTVVSIRSERDRFSAVELADGDLVHGDRLVIAAGAWSAGLARWLGLRLPIQPGKGYHVNLGGMAVRPATTCVLAETLVAVTPLDQGVRLAGTVELGGLDLTADPGRLARLREGAEAYLQGLDQARMESSWCGLRPMTCDGLPVVGWAPGVDGVFIATGHAMMGFLLGPLTGRVVSEAILDRATSVDIGALRATRF